MREFEADIGRDGTIYHLSWHGHAVTARHYDLPENTSPNRQNYFEFDLRAPFIDNLGLQERGIESPPEAVFRAAERLSQRLRNWQKGRDLRSIPQDWGDVVEHVYEVRGDRTPKYLNGRGGVYFTGELGDVSEGRIERLIGSARIERLAGTASIGQMWGRSCIEEMDGNARVESTWQAARIEHMKGTSIVDMTCQSSSIGRLDENARVLIMNGATRVDGLFGSAFCACGADGSVNTPDASHVNTLDLSANHRWKAVVVVPEGEPIYA
jgi:hypothetical protein